MFKWKIFTGGSACGFCTLRATNQSHQPFIPPPSATPFGRSNTGNYSKHQWLQTLAPDVKENYMFMWKTLIKLQSSASNRICLQCCILHNKLEWINKKLPGWMPCPVWVLCLGLAGNRSIIISWDLVSVNPNALCVCSDFTMSWH